jgi:citrate lyase subunit beta/citryl-CoA lyase
MSSQTANLRRSLLYVPATNARALDKARTLDADVVILDLEDSIPQEAKDDARDAAVRAVKEGFPGKSVALRCNKLSSPWGRDDLKAAVLAGVDIVVLPKVAGAEVIEATSRGIGLDIELWAMIETCEGVLRLPEIAYTAKTTSLRGLLVGTNDLAAEIGCRVTVGREAMASTLSQIVVAARAYGMSALDGPYNDFQDSGGLEIQCRHAADLGFDGKSLIHPSQIEAANRAFSPSAERIAWARAVIETFDKHPKVAVIAVDGQMVERAMHLKQAQAIAAFALRAGG